MFIILIIMADMIFPLIPNAAADANSGPGAVSVTTYFTELTTTGADAFTLADGTKVGQLKKIILVSDGGDATLTPATFVDGSTVTFADVGDYVVLIYTGDGAGWRAIETGNDADGVSGPVIA
mgnify:CR=1 FL=1